jgi:two-component system, OmpR family, KDP operon response regulator KdpE
VRARGEEAIYRRGALVVDIIDCSVKHGGKLIRLTPDEFEILALLVRSSGRIVPYVRFLASPGDLKHCRSKQALRASIWSLPQYGARCIAGDLKLRELGARGAIFVEG